MKDNIRVSMFRKFVFFIVNMYFLRLYFHRNEILKFEIQIRSRIDSVSIIDTCTRVRYQLLYTAYYCLSAIQDIVLEGCDRAGKSTQAKLLVNALKQRNIPVKQRAFPDRTTVTGKIINDYLTKKLNFSLETAHMLFSANRWECKDEILKSLYSGTTVVIDRYAGSGAAYTAAMTGRCLHWCKASDRGLPSPDIVILLDVSNKTQCSRSNWGDERYENNEIQSHVASNYKKIMDQTWCIINADDDESRIHSQILQKILGIIHQVKDLPVGKLYESTESEN